MSEEIKDRLFEEKDDAYQVFQSKLIPTVDVSYFIGVRTPALRNLAKEYAQREDVGEFLKELPHKYFDENQLHAFILSRFKDYDSCMEECNKFFPYVYNWATCDQMSPKVFRKHRQELLEPIGHWIASDMTFTVRFAVGMLMEHYLDDDFDPVFPSMVVAVTSDEYYVRMMVAWYIATALAKQWDATIPYLEERRLEPWTHNKAIQKATESRRITSEQKEYLRGLKVKTTRQDAPKGTGR